MLVETADPKARGAVAAEPAHHPRLHAASGQHAVGISGPWQDAGPADVAVLTVLGVEATWALGRGIVVARGDLDAAWRWGYLTEPDADGTVRVSRAPDLRTAAEQGSSGARVAPSGTVGREDGRNPYVREATVHRNRHGVALDGSLRMLVLPLEVACRKQAGPSAARGRSDTPFAAGQWIGLLPEATAPRSQVDRARRAMDMGLGSPELIANRSLLLGHSELVFGASEATLDDCSAGEVNKRFWRVAPQVCLALWRVDERLILTVERLEAEGEPDGVARANRMPKPESELASAVDADILATLPALLHGTGLNAGLSLADAFPEQAQALGKWLTSGEAGVRRPSVAGRFFRRAGEATPTVMREPISELRVAAAERIRGAAVTEGLYLVTGPHLTQRAAVLVHKKDSDAGRDMSSGAPRRWKRLDLAEAPAEPGSFCAVRDDFRVVLINLEALSIYHEYRQFGGPLGLLTLPLAAHRASVALDYQCIEHAALTSDATRVGDHLEVLEKAQRNALRRRVARRLAAPERSHQWTLPVHLVSELFVRSEGAFTELDGEIHELSELFRASLERAQASRRERFDRIVSWVSPVAAFSVLVSMYAALASLPDRTHDQLLSAVPEAALVTGGIVAVGILVGVAWDRAVRGRRARNRAHPRSGGSHGGRTTTI